MIKIVSIRMNVATLVVPSIFLDKYIGVLEPKLFKNDFHIKVKHQYSRFPCRYFPIQQFFQQ